jgi:hypothetical protein
MAEEKATLEEWRKKWGAGILLTDSTLEISDVSEYVRYKTLEYRVDDLQDDDLWEVLKDDFPGFTVETFKNCHPIDIQRFRMVLRTNGVWVLKDPRTTVAQSLYNTLMEQVQSEWPEADIKQHLDSGKKFNSACIQHLFLGGNASTNPPTPRPEATQKSPKDTMSTSALPEEPLKDEESTPTPPEITSLRDPLSRYPEIPPCTPTTHFTSGLRGSPARRNSELGRSLASSREQRTVGFGDNPRIYTKRQNEDEEDGFEDEPRDSFRHGPERDHGRAIANLAKLYTEEDKYDGWNDNFDYKLIIFHNNCDTVGIPKSLRNKAYHRMLRGLARQHYFTNMKNDSQIPTLEQLCDATRNFFEGEEYHRRMLERWNTLTLRKLMSRTDNSGKTTIDCLELLILELRQIQNGLDPNLRTEKLLHRKVIDACQDIPSCKQACFKPSSSLSGLFNKLAKRSRFLNYPPKALTLCLQTASTISSHSLSDHPLPAHPLPNPNHTTMGIGSMQSLIEGKQRC